MVIFSACFIFSLLFSIKMEYTFLYIFKRSTIPKRFLNLFFYSALMNSSLPFRAIQPIRLVGISSRAPFCSIISESKLIYSSGNNIILENTKNNEQKILYTHSIHGDIHLIVHQVTLYNQHLLAIAVRDSATLMNVIVVVALNPAIFNLEFKREAQQVYYLRHVQQYQEIKEIHFFQEGSLFGIVSNYGAISSFSIMKSSNGDMLLHESYPHTAIFMRSAFLSKQGYVAVLLQEAKDGVRLCLMASDELSRRLYYSLERDKDEDFICCSFQSLQEDIIFLLALTSKGNLLIYKVNEFTAVLVARIDVKIKNQGHQIYLAAQPLGMQSAGNKVVVYYAESKTITLVQFSYFNPASCKVVVLKETLQKYPNIRAIRSLRISKDTCTVAGLFRLNSKSLSITPQNTPTRKTLTLSLAPSQCKNTIAGTQLTGEIQPQEQYIALQMDILQNLISYNDKECGLEQTLSLFGGHAGVRKTEYCTHSNSLFLLLQNRILKYYDLTPEFNSKGKYSYVGSKLQLWASQSLEQPMTIAAHPFNYSLVLVYHDIIKFHHYNCKSLFPPHIVASIKPANYAAYSPLGDKLILGHHSSLTLIDSYTYQIIKTISVNSQPAALLTSSLNKQKASKLISSVHFNSNEEMLVMMGQNSLSLVTGWQRSVAFGTFEGESEEIRQLAFDKVNNLALVVQADMISVFAKASMNSSRCCLVSKLELAARCVLVAAELGVLFIGAEDGSIIMLKWPHYQQKDLNHLHGDNRIYLFDEPVAALHVTSSMRYLYAISQKGSIAICQLQVADSQQVPPAYKEKLLKLADIPLKLLNCWLISRADEQLKEREIIKLRGEQVDCSRQHTIQARQQAYACEEDHQTKKNQFDQHYCQEIKKYEEDLSLQKILHSISQIKDEIKVVKKQGERDISVLKRNTDQQLNKHFQERTKLEQQLQAITDNAIVDKEKLKFHFKEQMTILLQNFETQSSLIRQKIQSSKENESDLQTRVRLEGGNTEQDRKEQMKIIRMFFQDQINQQIQTGQTIISKNRNTNIAMHNLQDKMGEIGLEEGKMEFDIHKVEMEAQHLKNEVISLKQTLEKNNVTYNRLMRKTRKQESQLHQQRKLAKKKQQNLNQISEQILRLDQHQLYLDQLHQKVSAEFVEIKEQQRAVTRSVQTLNAQLLQLKALKSKKNYEQGLAKVRWAQYCKTLGRQLQLCEQSTVSKLKAGLQDKLSEIQQNNLGHEFQTLQAEKQKMSLDANKWLQVKDSYRAGLRRNFRKLNDQNLKLTYQYNDLFKVSQDYKTYANYLSSGINNQLKVKDQPHKLHKFTAKERNKPTASFTVGEPKVTKNQKSILKKSVCISLHQQSGKFITQS